jgi:hypothetical protein
MQKGSFAIVLAGTLQVVMDDGSAEDFGKDNVMLLPPGHDAWTVGMNHAFLSSFLAGMIITQLRDEGCGGLD